MEKNERNKFEFELKVFSRFLKENGIYSKYAREFTKTKVFPFTPKGLDNFIRFYYPANPWRFMKNPIDRGLRWHATVDGFDYWCNINLKWEKFSNISGKLWHKTIKNLKD